MDSSNQAPKNRRASMRRPAKSGARATCTKGSMGLGANLALKVVDLSEEGVRLLVKALLEKGQEVEVTLMGPGLSRPLKVLAQVMWSTPAAEGNYWVGARFRKRLTYGELADIWR